MSKQNLPVHVAIIMDGNGRWAKKRALPRVMGHREGAKTVRKIVTHAVRSGVRYLSLFAFSTENWLRPKDEVSTLMDLLDDFALREVSTIMDNDVVFRVMGRTENIPENTRKKLDDLTERSRNNSGMVLNLALSYGGRSEIFDAACAFAKDAQAGAVSLDEADESVFARYIYNADIPDVDLLIRTSGEQRISNFMLWRAAYAELVFADKLWPDYSEQDFDAALAEYASRRRRFGKTDEQL